MKISTSKHMIRVTSSRHALDLLLVGAALASMLLAACGAAKTTSAPSAAQTATPTAIITSNWQTVHDAANTFTLRVPADWQVRQGSGSTYGNSKLGIAIDSVGYRYAAPAAPTKYFDVSVGVYQTKQQHSLICTDPPFAANQMLNGLPAAAFSDTAQWFVYAQNAYFMLHDYYPGISGLGSSPTPPPPTAQIQADASLMAAILASFTPQPNKALVCP